MMSQPNPDKGLLTWPLVQQLYTRVAPSSGLPTFDARLINAYAELIPGTKDYWIYKRPGISAAPAFTTAINEPGGAYTYGIPNSNGTTLILSVVGGQLYAGTTLVPAFSVAIGAPCTFETINSNPTTIMILAGPANSSSGWLYTPSTGVCVQILDTSFITFKCVPGIAFLDDWTFVMDTSGTIWNTQGSSDASTWSLLNSIQATNYADAGVYLARQLNYVVAMKQWSTQIFYDAAAQVNGQGSPLGIVPDALIPYGCAHPYTVAKIDETLIWMTTNQNLQPQIIVLDNLSPLIVSSPSIERILKNFKALSGFRPPFFNTYSPGAFAWGMKIAGHRLYGLTLISLNITLVFDLDSKLWYIWTDSNGNYWPYGFSSCSTPDYVADMVGVQYFQNLVNGQIYSCDDMYTNPGDGLNITNVDIYTPVTDFGTLRNKQLNDMYFESDVVPGNRMFARYTDDDYQSWSGFREVRLDVIRPQLDDEGSFERRAYHFRHAALAPFRIRSTALDLDLGVL